MGLSLAAFLAEEKELPIPIGSQTLMIAYRPHQFSRAERKAIAGEKGFVDLIDYLLKKLVRWDMTRPDGKGTKEVPVPLTFDELEQLPEDLLRLVERAIAEDERTSGEASASA